ncbi:MAG: phenylalanine--tRNA ligase subunit alpha [Proteobacteria bacterium]|nr:phenylalanine--tRNA ligase subunit alpha [Pseudomonadota bacterium]
MSDLETIRKEATQAVASAQDIDALEKVRVAYLGKTGVITSQMKSLGTLPPEERKTFGASVNVVKDEITALIENTKQALETAALSARLAHEKIDITLPVRPEQKGSIHPITQVMEELTAIFGALGFTSEEGPDIEDDFHNFTALNIPANHPARQMHDTFYIKDEKGEGGNGNVLRTHTSPVQIRVMERFVKEKQQSPLRFIAMGRTYRCDSDMTHSPMFHQIEGLVIEEGVTMANLKGCLTEFVRAFFGRDDIPLRFRPSFFPFTEPSAEVDIGCSWENGELKIGAGKSWLEIGGCGMINPNVLKNVGLDSTKLQGFAFGMGIERMAMLKYGIPDLRPMYESDIRWLNHYNFGALDIPSLVKGVAG